MIYDTLINEMFRNTNLSTNSCSSLSKEEKSYVFKAEAIGLNNDDISIEIKNSTLEIKNISEKSGKWISRLNERIKLGSKVNTDLITAKLKNGLLEVVIPIKEEHTEVKRIKIM